MIGYATRLSETDYVGLHIYFFDSGDIERTTVQHPDGGLGDYQVRQYNIRAMFAKSLMSNRLKLGASIKYLREKIYNAQMQSIAFDIGANFDTKIFGTLVGVSVNNIGPEVQFFGEGTEVPTDNIDEIASAITEPWPMPLTFRFGVSADVIGSRSFSVLVPSADHRLTLATDFIKSNDYRLYTSLGAEYCWNDMSYARIGTRLGHDDTAGLSFGIGIKFKGIMVDYAYVDYGDLSTTSQFGISLEF